jgi:hypothetical protein
MVSQVLTLFTTPVIYLAFDRLARRFRKAVHKEVHTHAATGSAQVSRHPVP